MGKKTPEKIKTRSSGHFFFKSRDLPQNELPTILQLLEYYYFLKDFKRVDGDIFMVIAVDLIAIWEKGGIPTTLTRSVRNKLKETLKPIFEDIDRNKKRVQEKGVKNSISSKFEKCFIISKCHCFLTAKSAEDVDLSNCGCVDINKVRDIPFYANQLFKHKIPRSQHLYISPSIDKKESLNDQAFNEKVERRTLRENQRKAQLEKHEKSKVEQFQESHDYSDDEKDVEGAKADE